MVSNISPSASRRTSMNSPLRGQRGKAVSLASLVGVQGGVPLEKHIEGGWVGQTPSDADGLAVPSRSHRGVSEASRRASGTTTSGSASHKQDSRLNNGPPARTVSPCLMRTRCANLEHT